VHFVVEFLKVLTYKAALDLIKQNLPPKQIEYLTLLEANYRVLAQDIISNEDLPSFSRTTVDGYAVFSRDTFGSSESLPAYLQYAGQVKMGEHPNFQILPGQCAWIPTGGMMPDGADGAVMVEYTDRIEDSTVLIYRPVGPGENIMHKGEDLRTGQTVLPTGKLLAPQDIGILASLGIDSVPVYKEYSVGILSTGDEIIPIYQTPSLGEVRDVNSYTLAAAVRSCNANPQTYPIVKDDFKLLKTQVEKVLAKNDLLIMSGGSSVGLKDVTLDVLLSFPDSELLFHGIAVKPGKPTLAVRIADKLVIGLPGHPVSALMIFYVMCAPVLRKRAVWTVKAPISINVASQAGRDDFIPVKLTGSPEHKIITPLLGKSGIMSILSQADGYIHIPYEQQGIVKNDVVSVYLFK